MKKKMGGLVAAIFSVMLLFAACGGATTPAPDDPVLLPVMRIYSPLNPFTMPRTEWHDGVVSFSSPFESFSRVDARLRGRGNSTWWQGEAKRPLRVRFDRPRAMMGSNHVATDWILLADYFDRSLMRNYAALTLGRMLDGLSFTPAPQHIQLYINDEYVGVYLLTDERDTIAGRLDQLQLHEDPARSGFLIELNARAHQYDGEEGVSFFVVNEMMYDFRFPRPSGRTPEHVAYAEDYIGRVSEAIRFGTFDEVAALIDIDSFVDFYLVQELFKNPDVHFLSVFMYIYGEGDERRLYKGPIWDFDIAAGNLVTQPIGWEPRLLYAGVVNYWYRYLLMHPEFFDATAARWFEIRDNEVAEMITHVRELAIRYEAEFDRNFERHPHITADNLPPPAEEIGAQFMPQVEFLLDWLEARADWMSSYFLGNHIGMDRMWALVEFYTYLRPFDLQVDNMLWPFSAPRLHLQSRFLLTPQELAGLLGLTVRYDEDANTLTFTRGSMTIVHPVETSIFIVNGVSQDFGIPASVIARDTVFIPVRPMTDALGYGLRWNADERILVFETR